VDVRGRQLAWLIVTAPVAVLLTVAGLIWPGAGAGLAPWAVALLPVAIGGGAGLVVLISVLLPVRMPDPHRRAAHPGQDGGAISGMVWLTLGALAVLALPVVAVLIWTPVTWTAVPVGVLTGAGAAWGLGRWAYRRLERRGPELLARIR
jgi:ABC-2 type transport system permease protein